MRFARPFYDFCSQASGANLCARMQACAEQFPRCQVLAANDCGKQFLVFICWRQLPCKAAVTSFPVQDFGHKLRCHAVVNSLLVVFVCMFPFVLKYPLV